MLGAEVTMSRWIRKSELDARIGRETPVPTQVISNEEYAPPPQTRAQREVERRLDEIASRLSRSLGMSRRRFLRSSCGMAAAFTAMNEVFGPFFRVHASELTEPAASQEADPDYFVLDAQTHHVNALPPATGADRAFMDYLVEVRRFGANWNEALADREIAVSELYRETFIREVFLESDTDVAVVSALPQMSRDAYLIDPEEIAKTKNFVNELTDSRRVLGHGMLSPELGERNLDAMTSQVETLMLDAWKGYPGQPLGPNGAGWWLDDEKLAYPALELAQKLGVKNVCLHKGLPAPGFSDEHCHPKDVFQAALDFPGINFLIYHAGFQGLDEAVMNKAEAGFADDSYVPWVSDLCDWKKKNENVQNVYLELGATFGMTAITSPNLCAHMLGMILSAFGEDHLIWGTDSIWWGSPQWQIEALKRLEMPEPLAKRFGYSPLTTEVKRKIFGLNAARVYGVDPEARRNPLPGDYVDRLKRLAAEAGFSERSNLQYGWVLR
jgi:predicted TIM-barrel fold metal-dependent hydrolase